MASNSRNQNSLGWVELKAASVEAALFGWKHASSSIFFRDGSEKALSGSNLLFFLDLLDLKMSKNSINFPCSWLKSTHSLDSKKSLRIDTIDLPPRRSDWNFFLRSV